MKEWHLYFGIAWLFFIGSFFIEDNTNSNLFFIFFVIFTICAIIFFFLEMKLDGLERKYKFNRDETIILALLQIHKDLEKLNGRKK